MLYPPQINLKTNQWIVYSCAAPKAQGSDAHGVAAGRITAL